MKAEKIFNGSFPTGTLHKYSGLRQGRKNSPDHDSFSFSIL